MADKFKPVWGDRAPPLRVARRPSPGASSADTDAESGSADGGAAAALRALKAMYDRGLIGREEYEARRAEIEAGA